MHDHRTTASVQRYLVALAGHEDPDPIVRALLARAAARLQGLCTNMLRKQYPRLMHGPLGVQEDEMLSLLVERLIKAMRQVRPSTVREFFALANQHLRWELNEFARRLASRPRMHALADDIATTGPPTEVPIEAAGIRQILEAIDRLPEDEREVFSLVHIQGLTHAETAHVLDVSTKTVQRRLHQAVSALAGELSGLVAGDLGHASAEGLLASDDSADP
ncbi:MAG: sigma-70 family RNA polymerase sigma factor [Phycisphaerales bacterium]|nr:sigma-70 family RNA polymerase sigma factor [Phycisphaerales bacterium]